MTKTKLIIIGSGPAGYTAGIYAARANLKPILFTGTFTGGQLTLTSEIENFPGFPEPILGSELMDNMQKQAKNLGVEMIESNIKSVNLNQKPFTCTDDTGKTYEAESIIIATGANARWPDIKDVEKFIGFGLSACATCDGFFYRNKDVIIIGGGNTAAMEALHLSHIAKSVTLIHRRDSLRADKVMQDRVFANNKIKIIWSSIIEDITEQQNPFGVKAAKIRDLKTNELTEIPTDGIFVSIGSKPNTDIFKGQLELDDSGYIITTPDSTKTNIEGVFAAGDVKNPQFKQAIIAAASGSLAAIEAINYLEHQTNND